MPRVITNPEDEEITTLPTIAESWRVPTGAIDEAVEEAIEQLGPFVGTDGTTAGQAGLVPAPATTDADKYLKSDGTWAEGGASAILYDGTGQNTDGAMTQKATTDAIGGKQNTLTAGANITISGDEISATDTTYTAGTGLSLTGTEFSADTTVLTTQTDLSNGLATKQNTLTAGSNIQINNDTISATDTTYSDFTGTDGSTAGTAGLVPAPATADADKFLKADGTWAEAGGGGGSGIPTDATFWGQSYDSVNKRVKGDISLGVDSNNDSTHYIKNHATIGNYSSLILSNGMSALAVKTITANQAQLRVYDGATSVTVQIKKNASYGGLSLNDSRIISVADPVLAQDAATKNYVDSIYPVGAVFASTSATAPTIAGGTWTEIGAQTVGSSTVHYYERTA